MHVVSIGLPVRYIHLYLRITEPLGGGGREPRPETGRGKGYGLLPVSLQRVYLREAHCRWAIARGRCRRKSEEAFYRGCISKAAI